MKTVIAFFAFGMLLLVQTISAQEHIITAQVVNVTSDAGTVGFALYDKTNFMKKPLKAKTSKIKNGVASVSFEQMAPGEYAIICYHDKNENGRMDFEPNGMPLEDYGTSNNVITYGPPLFYNSKFALLDKNITLAIKF